MTCAGGIGGDLRYRCRLAAAVLIGLLLAGCAVAEPGESTASSTRPPSFATLPEIRVPHGLVAGDVRPLSAAAGNRDFAASLADAEQYARETGSYALLVWYRGRLVLEQYFADYDRDLRPESASMHKSVLGLLVLAAVQDGIIASVTARIGDYIPEWADDARGDIRIHDLLTMASGLQPLSSEGGADSPAIRFYRDGAAARATILGLPLARSPGSRFHYANTNSQLLGLIVENASGLPYEEYLSERIWKPLGADDAFVWHNESDGFARTYTSLFARARDWLRIGLLIKDRGRFGGKRIIAADLIDAMTRPSPTNPNYGYQIWLGQTYEDYRFYNADKVGMSVRQSEPYVIGDIIYLDGAGGQRVYISREADLVIVRTGDFRPDWDDARLPNDIARALR